MLQTIKNAWKLPELRAKILFTAFILIIYRLGSVMPIPFVDSAKMALTFETYAEGSLFQYFSMISGEAFSRAYLFALSINPYITSQIVIQLLTIAIPYLERLAKEGDEGRKKIGQISRVCTVILGVVTAIGYYTYLKNQLDVILVPEGVPSWFVSIVIVGCYSAGAAIIMWLAEKINEHGIGNGISIILFANIISVFPAQIYAAITQLFSDFKVSTLISFVVVVLVVAALFIFIVHMSNAERRVPVQYAKRQVGRRMYGGQSTYLPLKLNMTGVMPIIFASSIVSLPTTIALIFPPKGGSIWEKITSVFSYNSPVYAVLFFVLIIAFAYFYISISFNPIEVANNLKKNGGSITGIRPGKPTTDYLTKILGKITLIGAIFLGIIATLPLVISMATSWSSLAFGGSSIIIIVGVVVETAREIETQMQMRHYKGFLE